MLLTLWSLLLKYVVELTGSFETEKSKTRKCIEKQKTCCQRGNRERRQSKRKVSVISRDIGRSKECRESDLVIEADVMILECYIECLKRVSSPS